MSDDAASPRALGAIMDAALRKSIKIVPDPAADRIARAIAAALPLIDDMWGQFPYAAGDQDDEIMSELRLAAQAYRNLQNA